MKSHKNIAIFSTLLAIIFIAAQVTFSRTSNVGLCSPYLGAPAELSHPAFQSTDHGFPLPFVTITTDLCSDNLPRYDWSPIGVGVDPFVLALLTYPFWRPSARKLKTKDQG